MPRTGAVASLQRRLSVPFEAMSSALNQNKVSLSASIGEKGSRGDGCPSTLNLQLSTNEGTPGFFNSMTASGKPLTKPTK